MGNNIRSSSRPKALAPSIPMPPLADAMDAVHLSVDRFCLLAGVEALAEMMEEDATTVCGARHRRHGDRRGYRWGRTHSEIGYHGGKVKVARPRVRDRAGKEVSLESWQALRDGNLLLEWALNLMVLNVSTRKYHRAVRLPEGDLAKARGDGTSKSAVSRRFVALSRKKMKAWLASDLSELDLLVIQIDGLHVGDHVLMAAIGVDGNGDKHVLAVVEGATENTVVVQALIDNLLARGLDPTLPRLFIVDGAKALSKAIRNTFGVAAAIQRCQVHKGRNIIERLPQHLHASVKKALRQAWDQDDANKAERLLRNLVRRLEHEEPGVSGSILEGLDEILTVIRLGLPHELRRSLACTNIVENALGTVRQVTRNVKRWRHAEMALRWTAAGLLEAQKTFRRLKAYRQLPILRNALQEHLRKAQADSAIETIMKAIASSTSDACPTNFNRDRDIAAARGIWVRSQKAWRNAGSFEAAWRARSAASAADAATSSMSAPSRNSSTTWFHFRDLGRTPNLTWPISAFSPVLRLLPETGVSKAKNQASRLPGAYLALTWRLPGA